MKKRRRARKIRAERSECVARDVDGEESQRGDEEWREKRDEKRKEWCRKKSE